MVNLARITGFLASLGIAILLMVFIFFNPYTPGMVVTLPIILMLLLALAGMAVSLAARPFWMLVIAALSFIPTGLYLLGTPGVFRWIGVFNLVFLIAGLLMLAARRR